MAKLMRKRYLLLFLIIIILASFSIQTKAFSFNPIPFLERTVSIIVTRVTDIINYMVLQGKYIFTDYVDPNTYIDIPAGADNLLTTTTKNVVPVGKPNSVGATTLPKVNVNIPIPNTINSKPPDISIPGLINNFIPLNSDNSLINYDTYEILKYSNIERQAVSLPPLLGNSTLDSIAALRADDLFTNQYFEHDSPDGKSATDLAVKLGFEYLLIGENLALGNFDGSQGIVAAWMASPGHRANILNNKYRDLGVAIKTGMYKGQNTLIAVQIFALPKAYCFTPNQGIKSLIDSSSLSIKKMQAEALVVYNSLNIIKTSPNIDGAYYSQKIQEYNYLARKVNEAVAGLKIIIDSYNIDVAKYNSCLKSVI